MFSVWFLELSQPKVERNLTEINKQSLHALHTSTEISNSYTLNLCFKRSRYLIYLTDTQSYVNNHTSLVGNKVDIYWTKWLHGYLHSSALSDRGHKNEFIWSFEVRYWSWCIEQLYVLCLILLRCYVWASTYLSFHISCLMFSAVFAKKN